MKTEEYTEADTNQKGGAAAWAILALAMFGCLALGIVAGSWIPYLTR